MGSNNREQKQTCMGFIKLIYCVLLGSPNVNINYNFILPIYTDIHYTFRIFVALTVVIYIENSLVECSI